MEKKLRACRVNILPRNGGYLSEPCTPAPVKKKQDPISPSPAAVEKATNPIALRYWNQCMDTHSQVTSPVMERRNQNNDVVKILSTAGTGIKRENEIKEALGNINRFYTVDKIRKDDAERVSRSRTRNYPEKIEITVEESEKKPYNMIKEEQIKIAKERSNFQNISVNRIPKSPKPFRRGVSETRITSKDEACSCIHGRAVDENNLNHFINEKLPKMNQNEKKQLGLVLFDHLPEDIMEDIIVKQLSKMPGTSLISVMTSLPNETVNAAVKVLFPRTKDDVKLSLILDSVPKLTKQLRK